MSNNNTKPNCFECRHIRNVPGEAHKKCEHPKANMGVMMGVTANELKVSGSAHGIRMGWFYWPLLFDPVWLNACDGFEEKEKEAAA